MSRIKPIAETPDTVTLTRADFEALLEAAEDVHDIAVVNAQIAREAALGKAEARADYLPIALAERLWAGESPVRIWREHRGMTQRALASTAAMSTPFLCEIEHGTKQGGFGTMLRIAKALMVPVEDLR